MVTIEVEEVLKGTPPEKLILFQYGGEYQNEICMPPEEFPLLEVGKTYLLYLNDDYIHDGETLYTVVGGYRGWRWILTGNGRRCRKRMDSGPRAGSR